MGAGVVFQKEIKNGQGRPTAGFGFDLLTAAIVNLVVAFGESDLARKQFRGQMPLIRQEIATAVYLEHSILGKERIGISQGRRLWINAYREYIRDRVRKKVFECDRSSMQNHHSVVSRFSYRHERQLVDEWGLFLLRSGVAAWPSRHGHGRILWTALQYQMGKMGRLYEDSVEKDDFNFMKATRSQE